MTGVRAGSLQVRLTVLVLTLVAVFWVCATVLTWFDVRHELGELLDGHLAQAAALLIVQQTKADGDEDDGMADAPLLHKYAPQVAFQVFHEGRLVLRSSNAGDAPMSVVPQGFTTETLIDGGSWRVFGARGAERDIQVFVAEKTASRNTILWAVLRSVLLPMAIILPLLAWALWWGVRQGLVPLRHLGQVLALRQPQVLEPIKVSHLPSEMQPLVQALNALLARIEHMVVVERRFTADAAHELRTPIAAIRAQVQVAQGAVHNPQQRDHALTATLAGCDRATRLVDQLLTLARLEFIPAGVDALAAKAPAVNLVDIARHIAAELAPGALVRHQQLALESAMPCWVRGDDVLLGVLVRNLVDNALRYCPDGARIRVEVASQSGNTVLRVEDSGPAMSNADMARLGERFYRVLGTGQSGSGLGWSIVKRIVDVHGAQVHLQRSSELGGLSVTVSWPPV
jgi:two-component system sensor histidine kinase QseC